MLGSDARRLGACFDYVPLGAHVAVAAIGGGSGAVGASSHAACERFRGTDPLVTGLTRRRLADQLKFPDAGGIPEARWMRAMTFERLVRDERFASQVATTTVGQLALDRPKSVVIANANGKLDRTAQLLAHAHARALSESAATVIHDLAVPFVGYEDVAATDVKPDFVVVAPKAPFPLLGLAVPCLSADDRASSALFLRGTAFPTTPSSSNAVEVPLTLYNNCL